MKNYLLQSLFICLSFVMILLSCGSDDEESNSNKINYQGNSYSFTTGLLEEFGDNGNGSYDWDVTLITNGLVENNGDFTGTGSLIYLDLNSDSASGLTSGTYNWATDRDAFTFTYGNIGINYNSNTDEAEIEKSIYGGSININIDGNNTTIDLNLMDEDGNAITGNYTGVLKNI